MNATTANARSKNFRDNFITRIVSIRALGIQKASEKDKECIYIIHLTQTKLLSEVLDSLLENLSWILETGRLDERVCVFIRGIILKCDIWMDSLFQQQHKREDRKFFRTVMDKLDTIKETCETFLKDISSPDPFQAPAPAPAPANTKGPHTLNITPEEKVRMFKKFCVRK